MNFQSHQNSLNFEFLYDSHSIFASICYYRQFENYRIGKFTFYIAHRVSFECENSEMELIAIGRHCIDGILIWIYF